MSDTESTKQKIADPAEQNQTKVPRLALYVLFAVVVLGLAMLAGMIIGNRKAIAPSKVTSGKSTKVIPPKSNTSPGSTSETTSSSCASGSTEFRDKDFGARFCYPSSWGSATLADAKVAPSDTGHRQSITFSSNPLMSVGGVSEDWSTTVGRGVGCLETQKDMPALSSYNAEWHNISGTGMAIDFAERSLASKQGGYSLTESVSSMLVEGVCAHGYKQINGSRYKVVSAAFYRTFPEASGITTPSAHMAEPNVLFSTEQRNEFDALLASLVAY